MIKKKEYFEGELFTLCKDFGNKVEELYLKYYSVKLLDDEGKGLTEKDVNEKRFIRTYSLLHDMSNTERNELSRTDPIIIISPMGIHNLPFGNSLV